MTDDRPAPRGPEPRVLAFVAPWCGPCRRLEPLLDEVAVAATDDVRLETVRVDEHPDEVDRHGVRATPTTIALRGDVEVARVVGAMGRAQVEQLFAAAAAPGPAPAVVRTPSAEVALRVGVAVVLAVAGLVLHQPLLVGVAVVIGAITAGFALPRRRRSRTALAPGPVAGSAP